LDEFFRFVISNDLSGEEEEEKSSFIEDEELIRIIITDDSDDDEFLPQASDNRVRFSPSNQEARYGFSLQARPKPFRRHL
jgi:hypothetical protein